MKRFLALFLVLVLAFSVVLVSCKDNNSEDPEETTEDEEDFVGIGGTTSGSETSATTAPIGNTHTDFTWTDDTNGTMVYVQINGLNVRSDTNSSSGEDNQTWRATANFGESYKRIRYNDSWTQIDYKGNQYYVSSKYVTTDDGKITFTPDTEESTVYVVASSLNLRYTTYVGEDVDNLCTNVSKGVELTRIATSKNGTWIKVRCTYTPVGSDTQKTEEVYCKAEFVSAEKDATTASTTAPSHG